MIMGARLVWDAPGGRRGVGYKRAAIVVTAILLLVLWGCKHGAILIPVLMLPTFSTASLSYSWVK